MEEQGAILGIVIVLGFALCVAIGLTQVGREGPDTFVGDQPATSHATICNSSRGAAAGCGPDTRETTLRWTVGAGGTARTRLSDWYDGRPEEFGRIFGTLALDGDDECPASVRWTVTPLPAGPVSSGGPLRGEDEVDTARLPVPPGTTELAVELRRDDTAPCPATVVWERASLE
ncbi:hypothetical protein ACR9E3_09520 [Actinomycetospora sp. C-140]